MTNNSDKKTPVNEKSAYATIQPGDRPTKSKLVILFRKLKRQVVTELQDDYKPHVNNKIATRPDDKTNDDFICFHMRDGSSIASSGGVTVIGKKLK
ncbi:hypothetical protein [Paraglaciecola sp. 25GB23A]|uniref:hypothetical protein n=1 Tax=Paraglaciecola sp. 25GB23A TaxID=3156068 RepID=UPI0032AFFA34